MNDNVKLKGHITVNLISADGEVKEQHDWDNLIVNVGKDWIIDRMQANTPATASHIAIGSSATAANAGDTALGSLLAIKNGTTSQPASTTARSVATFAAGEGTGTVQEYGMYASGSALIGRVVTGSISKGASDSLQVTYDVSVS